MEAMPRRSLAFFGALALALLLSGCSWDGSPPSSETRDTPPQRPKQIRLIESTPAPCAVGERPDYFVPGDSPLALLGCARLGVSGKRVEFSGNVAHLDGGLHACVNPAYSGRGQRGIFIPAICKLDPPPSRFAIRDARQPRQAVRGYAFVIWGTTGASTDVVARFSGGTARAAVFKVAPELARDFGASPFGVFVIELPLSAACGPITVSGNRPDATERIPPQTDVTRTLRPGTPMKSTSNCRPASPSGQARALAPRCAGGLRLPSRTAPGAGCATG
jgi:hypothetical protein